MRKMKNMADKMKKKMMKAMVLGMTALALCGTLCGVTGTREVKAGQAFEQFRDLESGSTSFYKDMPYYDVELDLLNMERQGTVVESYDNITMIRIGNRICEVGVYDKKTSEVKECGTYNGEYNYFLYKSDAKAFKEKNHIDGNIATELVTDGNSELSACTTYYYVTGTLTTATMRVKWYDATECSKLNMTSEREDLSLSNTNYTMLQLTADADIDYSQVKWETTSDCVSLYPSGDGCYVEGNSVGTAYITATAPNGVMARIHVNVLD